jgi:hypothetical protein
MCTKNGSELMHLRAPASSYSNMSVLLMAAGGCRSKMVSLASHVSTTVALSREMPSPTFFRDLDHSLRKTLYDSTSSMACARRGPNRRT